MTSSKWRAIYTTGIHLIKSFTLSNVAWSKVSSSNIQTHVPTGNRGVSAWHIFWQSATSHAKQTSKCRGAQHACVAHASPGSQKQRDLQAEPLRFKTLRVLCQAHTNSLKTKLGTSEQNAIVIIQIASPETSSSFQSFQIYFKKINNQATAKTVCKRRLRKIVLIFFFRPCWLIGVGGERRMEHKFFSAQSFTSTQIVWNDNVLGICQCGIKTTVSNAFFELARSFPPERVGYWVGERKSPLDLLKFLQPKYHRIPEFQRQTFSPQNKLIYKVVWKICLDRSVSPNR